MDLSSNASAPDRAIRRRPTQARSRQRVEQILDAAGVLIAARGLGPVTMTDIADEAGMALTAVYRYFPSKQSVVRELALRTFDTDAELTLGFTQEHALPPGEWVVRAVEAYCHHHLRDNLRLQVRAAIHADAELSALDLEDSRRNAGVIADALVRDGVGASPEELNRRALIVVELIDALVRLAARVEPGEADAIIAEFARSASETLVRES